MSLYCNFYHETFDGVAWRSGPSSARCGASPFLSLNVRQAEYSALASLFFWPDALLPFYKALPPDLLNSDLCLSLMRLEGTIAWLPFESLFLEDWPLENILVTNRVAGPLARVFGDGLSPFPEVALRQVGMTPREIQVLRCGSVAERRVSRLWGRGRHELQQTVTDNRLPVTWTDSIAGCVGVSTTLAFQSLQSRRQDIRIIACTA